MAKSRFFRSPDDIEKTDRVPVTPLIPAADNGSVKMTATAQQSMAGLSSGFGVCSYAPDILCVPELICGGLVWILVSCTHVQPSNPLGWVMFVSVFCFVGTFLWLVVCVFRGHRNGSIYLLADFIYHLIAAMFYLSAAVPLATVTIDMRNATALAIYPFNYYQLDIAAVVFAHLATLLYFIHCILSACRWEMCCWSNTKN